MATSVLSMALAAALGAGPAWSPYGSTGGAAQATYAGQPRGGVDPASYGASYDAGGYGGAYGGYEQGGAPMGGPAGGGYPGAIPSGGAYPGNEPLFAYDSQYPWLHGYFQEIPAYGGFTYFRPYNYKHVLSQSQIAGGWGMSPTMPYSQQFWHRFQQQAAMSPQLSDNRGRFAAPMARSMMMRRPSSPIGSAMPATQEYIPASYTMPSDRSGAMRNGPAAGALPPNPPARTASAVPSAAAFDQQMSFQRFTRDRSETAGPQELPLIQPGR